MEEQISLRDRLAELQNDFDENRSEISSLQILNDVLRKTTAQTNQEREEIAQKFLERDCQLISFMDEVEKQKSEASLFQGKIAERELELNRLQAQIEGWTEQLAERDQAILLLQERLQTAAHKEGLYLELKKQFDEKNRVLHQTRVELFQSNTALEAVRLEQEQQKAGEMPEAERLLSNELAALEQERQILQQENEKLFDLVTLLSKESSVQIMERLSKHKQKSDPIEASLKKEASKKKAKKKKGEFSGQLKNI